jgi:choline dehydrogenase-like flavoprotein
VRASAPGPYVRTSTALLRGLEGTKPAVSYMKAVPGTHSYGCVVGGGTVTYGSSSWRHLPYEFRETSADSTIPSGTGMSDWPISYEELERYYTQPEWEMGTSGLRVNSPFVAPMSKDYPLPPYPSRVRALCSILRRLN